MRIHAELEFVPSNGLFARHLIRTRTPRLKTTCLRLRPANAAHNNRTDQMQADGVCPAPPPLLLPT
ncbi:MAG: hypothetical protein ACP5MD_09460 [Verrucomicrobiia bacterium]